MLCLPFLHDSEVIITSAPKPWQHSAIFSSSVATTVKQCEHINYQHLYCFSFLSYFSLSGVVVVVTKRSQVRWNGDVPTWSNVAASLACSHVLCNYEFCMWWGCQLLSKQSQWWCILIKVTPEVNNFKQRGYTRNIIYSFLKNSVITFFG